MSQSDEIKVEVTVPWALLLESGLSVEEAPAAMFRAFVISLYRQDRISSGKAARLLGMHRLTFIRMLAEQGVPYLDYTLEELEHEIAAARNYNG
jgi:predicted HTH domain antitoxin